MSLPVQTILVHSDLADLAADPGIERTPDTHTVNVQDISTTNRSIYCTIFKYWLTSHTHQLSCTMFTEILN